MFTDEMNHASISYQIRNWICVIKLLSFRVISYHFLSFSIMDATHILQDLKLIQKLSWMQAVHIFPDSK
jgi:hypothetical protein